MSQQLDMFGLGSGLTEPERRAKSARQLNTVEREEDWVRNLEDTGRYRILRKLMPRPIIDRTSSLLPRVGVLVDVETTGLDQAKDEVIEIGMGAFTYDDDGRIGDVVGVFSALRQPYAPIPPEITRLT